MTSTSSAVALVISAACLALVVWAISINERSRSIYGHSLPDRYAAPAIASAPAHFGAR